jgi:hypothetical protein
VQTNGGQQQGILRLTVRPYKAASQPLWPSVTTGWIHAVAAPAAAALLISTGMNYCLHWHEPLPTVLLLLPLVLLLSQ